MFPGAFFISPLNVGWTCGMNRYADKYRNLVTELNPMENDFCLYCDVFFLSSFEHICMDLFKCNFSTICLILLFFPYSSFHLFIHLKSQLYLIWFLFFFSFYFRRHLILSCQGSLNIFPFDDPLCSFALESSKDKSLSFSSYFVFFSHSILLF